MTTLVDGRALAEKLRARVSEDVAALPSPPGLATIQVGDDPASTVYVRNKHRACRATGLTSARIDLPSDTSASALFAEIDRLNANASVHGILVQLPLPRGIDPNAVAERVDPSKDVDGLHPVSMGRLFAGRPGHVPCTPRGCITILDEHQVPIEGARAVVIGRSNIVGKPLAMLLSHRNATVTLCHSRTVDIAKHVRDADIVVAAVGIPRFVEGDWIRPGASVIDVGVNRVGDGLVGDVDFDAVNGRAGLLTPVPGGVGPLTIAMLLANTVLAYRLQQGALGAGASAPR
jgi:methylenetetrahydrofolate dehydrogenase (NADP+)/methenyltetrahydrofolate cyclohydrolase